MSRRSLFLLVMVAAIGGTVALATALLGDGDAGRRRDRADEGFIDPPSQTPIDRPTTTHNADSPRSGQKKFHVTGFVRDESGRPVPGAVVRVTAWNGAEVNLARTDAAGRYALVTAQPAFSFDVWAAGFLPLAGTDLAGATKRTFDYVCDGDGPWGRDFTLERAASLRGRVLGPNAEPVAGARVYVVSPEHQLVDGESIANVQVTGADGAYEFPGVPAGVWDVGVRARGYLPRLARDVRIPENGAEVADHVLARGRELDVLVVPGDARLDVLVSDARLRDRLLPPGGIAVLADALVGREWAAFPVTRADVPARLGGLPGAVDVRAASPLVGVDPVRDVTAPSVTLTAYPLEAVAFVVRDAITGEVLAPRVERRSDGAGPFTPVAVEGGLLLPVDARRHVLRFVLDGYEPLDFELPRVEKGAAHELVLQPEAGGETGRFFVRFTPELRGRVALVGRDADGRRAWVKHVDAADGEGRWEVKGVPFGTYVVSVLATGKVPALLPRVVVAAGTNETHTVALTEGGGLEMKVEGPDGQLLDKVHVELVDAAGRQVDVHVMTNVSDGRAFLSVNYLPSAATARADSGLAPGAYRLTAGKEGYEPASTDFTVPVRGVAEVTLRLRRR